MTRPTPVEDDCVCSRALKTPSPPQQSNRLENGENYAVDGNFNHKSEVYSQVLAEREEERKEKKRKKRCCRKKRE